MTLEEWNKNPLRTAAYEQGWRISEAKIYENRSEPEYRIVRTRFNQMLDPQHIHFTSDMGAREFVKQQAEKGDELAISALNVLITEKLSGA